MGVDRKVQRNLFESMFGAFILKKYLKPSQCLSFSKQKLEFVCFPRRLAF